MMGYSEAITRRIADMSVRAVRHNRSTSSLSSRQYRPCNCISTPRTRWRMVFSAIQNRTRLRLKAMFHSLGSSAGAIATCDGTRKRAGVQSERCLLQDRCFGWPAWLALRPGRYRALEHHEGRQGFEVALWRFDIAVAADTLPHRC